MGAKSSIEWTDATWNPVRGCSMAKGSEAGGCLNCYAARLSARNLPEMRSPTTGESFARILDSGPRWTGKVELIEKALTLPLGWRKPRRIFVNSLSDLFHEAIPDEAIDRVFLTMACCPQHTFQILTKRPERMLAFMQRGMHGKELLRWPSVDPDNLDRRWPLSNVWLGVSIEDQKTADARIPILLRTPAANRFISYEPALGPVDLRPWLRDHRPINRIEDIPAVSDVRILDWVIIGGESGPGARPFDLGWARDTIRACQTAGVQVFVKQLGAVPIMGREAPVFVPDYELRFKDRKGGDMTEWPEDLRVRELPA